MKIFVRAKTGAKKQKIRQIDDDHFEVWIKEPPIDGKANNAIIDLLADFFNIPKSSIELKSGSKSKNKTFLI